MSARCPECGGRTFTAQVTAEIAVLVKDDGWEWLGELAEAVFEIGAPHGPYVCDDCLRKFDELPEETA